MSLPHPLERHAVISTLLLFIAFGQLPACHADDWKYDVLHLKNGHEFAGLLVAENSSSIQFKWVHRRPGTSTLVVLITFRPDEVDHIDRLPAREHEALAERIKNLDPTGKREKSEMEALVLQRIPWLGKEGTEAFSYCSTYFLLESNAGEDIVRRAAVRLEQVYRAYARYLPPKQRDGKPTGVLLFGSLADYRTFLKQEGDTLLNPAFYDMGRNRILCASNLEQLAAQLRDVRRHHQHLLAELRRHEMDARKQHRGRLPAAVAAYLHKQRSRIEATNRKNDRAFDQATQHLFQTLYHEAFHAYLDNFVYPHRDFDVPRWLNEGLAQIFEAGIVEAGEIRVGYADPQRLADLRRELSDGTALSLREVLESNFRSFLVTGPKDRARSLQYYRWSWALAHYLMFKCKVLNTPAFDRYIRERRRSGDPIKAFEGLIGQPLAAVEKDFLRYIRNLQPEIEG